MGMVTDIRLNMNDSTEKKEHTLCSALPGYYSNREYKYLGVNDKQPIVDVVKRLREKLNNVTKIVISKTSLSNNQIYYRQNSSDYKTEDGITFEKTILKNNNIDEDNEIYNVYIVIGKYRLLKYQFITDLDDKKGNVYKGNHLPRIKNINPYDYLIEQSSDVAYDMYNNSEKSFNFKEFKLNN